jgi:hypothetical protein
MRPSRSAPSVLLAASLCLSACSPDFSTPQSAQISCGGQADCPGGLVCRNGFCVSVAGGDAVAPGVVLGSATVTPSTLAAGGLLTVTFDVSEALQATPRVTLDVGGGTFRPLTLDPAASSPATLHYAFTYTAAGDEIEGRTSLVTADLLDTAGNRSSDIVLGAVVHDFTAPGVSLSSVALLPGPGNPLSRVVTAAAGTEVVIALVPDEPLAAVPPPGLSVTRPGGGSVAFAYDAAASGPGLATFTATVAPSDTDGDYQATVTWSDRAGNGASRTTDASFTVRTSAPVLLVDQAAVRFVRSPWGSSAAETLGAFTVPAGAFFGLSPADPLSGAATLPATAFLLQGGRPLERVRVWGDGARGTLLGDLLPAGGGWERKALDRRDTPSAWVTGVDDAGNESAPVRIQASEWVATSNPPVGVPVHEVVATASVSSALAQAPVGMSAAEVAAAPGRVAAADDDGATPGRSLSVSSSPGWIATPTSPGELPSGRGAHALAYDPLRRRVVLFGGSTVPGSSADALDDTWEWDGARWTQAVPLGASPPRRSGHVLFFDARRGTVVLFGGSGSGGSCLDDLWEWDGVRWRPIDDPSASRPVNCGRGAGAYDPDRGVLVYWPGEAAEVWTWDGSAWTLEPGGGTGPSARRFPGMAYDPARGAVVLYGGWSLDFSTVLADTWEWNGAWKQGNPASAPGPRHSLKLAWNPVAGRVALTGGRAGATAFGDVWTWNGSDWQDVSPPVAGPAPRADHGFAWDDVTGRLMVVDGVAAITGVLPADTWHLGAGGWVALPTSFTRPTRRKNHAMASDPTSGGVLLFGGVVNNSPLSVSDVQADTWRYRSPTWTQLSPAASPSARVGHAMAATGTGVALFGGAGPGGSPVYRNDLHLWNGSTWVPQPATGGPPPARTGAGLAWDAARNRVVMFGGSNGAPLGDVWEHDGTQWVNRTPGGVAPRPAARAYHGMAYDTDLQRVIVFGGCNNPNDGFARCGSVPSPDQTPSFYYDDVWAWDGTAWTALAATTGLYRGSFASAWAPPQHRTVAFGGYDGWEVQGLPAEWDGLWWASFLDTGAPATLSGAMAHDASSGRVVLFGGDAGIVSAQSWEWDAQPGRQPAVQLTVSTAPASVDPATVEEVRVRAVCGGLFAPYAAGSNGSALWGWSTAGGRLGLGGWVRLAGAAGGVSVTTGGLAAPQVSRIEWASASPAEARRFLLTSRTLAAFQCRPDGPAVDPAQRGVNPAQGFGEATVAADYLEVRVRYRAP